MRPRLASYVTEKRIVQIKSRSKERAFDEIAAAIAAEVPDFTADQIRNALLEREKVANTWVAPGLAIPHARLPIEKGRYILAVGRSPRGIEYTNPEKGPVHLMMVILAPDGDEDGFLSVLAAVAGLLKDDSTRQAILDAETPQQLIRTLSGKRRIGPPGRRTRYATRTDAVLAHARQLAASTGCTAIFLFGDPIQNRLPDDWAEIKDQLILVSAGPTPASTAEKVRAHIQLPVADLTRFGQLNLVILVALSRGLINSDDLVAYVTGAAKTGTLDTVSLIDVDREYNMFFRPDTHGFLSGDLKPEVLERVLHIAHDLADEGREGKPVGALYVLGDSAEVTSRCRQMVLNPFRGYQEEDLNILDPSLEETIKEFSTIDGAFLIRGDGVLLAAGAYLKPGRSGKELPPGLGARHQAAASITASTAALAVAVSESTGRVTLFRNGQILLEIDRFRQAREPSVSKA